MLTALGIVAAVFTAVVCALVVIGYVQLKARDPLNDPVLLELREKYSGDQGNEALKEKIRDLDFMARRAYFSNQHHMKTGGYLIAGGVVLVFAAFGLAGSLDRKTPVPGKKPDAEQMAEEYSHARLYVIAGGLALVIAACSLIISSGPEPSGAETSPALGPYAQGSLKEKPTAKEEKPSSICPVFRGPRGWGYSECEEVPVRWDEKAGSNILWKVPVPLAGAGSPVVRGGKVFVSGATRESRKLFCFHENNGNLAWTGEYRSSPAASTGYEVFDLPESLMFAAATPAAGRNNVYAIFANGELAAFDIDSGEAVWSRVMGRTDGNVYGISSSLLVYDGSVIVPFDGDECILARLAGQSGDVIWESGRDNRTWSSPALINPPEGPRQIVIAGDPDICGYDLETGERIWNQKLFGADMAPSPVYGKGLVYISFMGCGMFCLDPSEKGKVRWSINELKKGTFPDIVSMVTDGSFLYQYDGNVLVCVNAVSGEVIYERKMPEYSCNASPIIVNDRLYLFGEKNTYVARVGAEWRLSAVNNLEEKPVTNPAVVDGRIYLRTEKHLYCIGRNGPVRTEPGT